MIIERKILDTSIEQITPVLAHSANGMKHLSPEGLDDRCLVSRVYGFMRSLLREVEYALTTAYVTAKESYYGAPLQYVTPSGKGNEWKAENKGLYVLVHGLNGRPNIWHNQLKALEAKNPNFEIRLPHVPQKGNCSLDEGVAPIEEMVRDYIDKHPGQPVCLIGVSNGARIAAELAMRLQDTNTPIKVSGIAGVLSGTTQMDLLSRLGLSERIFNAVLAKELAYGSDRARQLHEAMQGELPEGVERSYDFFASPDDCTVMPFTGSLPITGRKDESYFLAPGENHNSIVSRVAELQSRICTEWMQAHAG